MADPKPLEETQEPPPDEEKEPEQEAPAPEEDKGESDEGEGEGEPKPGEGEEETEAEPEEAKGGEAEPEERRKRAGGWQRRIERLERVVQQKDELIQRLATQGTTQTPQPAKDKTPTEKAEEWIDRRVEERLAAREQERQTKTAVEQFQRRTAAVRAKHDDFDEVVSRLDIPLDSVAGQALLTSEFSGDILYRLGTDPDELARISALPPAAQAREIGRLEAQLASSTAGPVKPKPAFRPPAPPTSVNGSASSTRSLEDMPLAEYKRAMRSGRR